MQLWGAQLRTQTLQCPELQLSDCVFCTDLMAVVTLWLVFWKSLYLFTYPVHLILESHDRAP
jgi:hypothetical protein